MSKYLLLVLLNAPFILYGMMKSLLYFKEGVYSRLQFLFRLVFWGGCLALLVLTKPIYDFLAGNKLTNSPPLSLADVLLATGCFLALTMIVRLYARLEKAERKLTEMNEALALRQDSES